MKISISAPDISAVPIIGTPLTESEYKHGPVLPCMERKFLMAEILANLVIISEVFNFKHH